MKKYRYYYWHPYSRISTICDPHVIPGAKETGDYIDFDTIDEVLSLDLFKDKYKDKDFYRFSMDYNFSGPSNNRFARVILEKDYGRSWFEFGVIEGLDNHIDSFLPLWVPITTSSFQELYEEFYKVKKIVDSRYADIDKFISDYRKEIEVQIMSVLFKCDKIINEIKQRLEKLEEKK